MSKSKNKYKRAKPRSEYSVREYAEMLNLNIWTAKKKGLDLLKKEYKAQQEEQAKHQILLNKVEASNKAIVTEELLQENAKMFADIMITKANEMVNLLDKKTIDNHDIIEFSKVVAGFLVNMRK